MQTLKRHDTNELIYKTETDLQTKIRNLWLLEWGRMEGRGSQGVWDGCVHTAIFKMDNQQGPNVQHMKLVNVVWQPGRQGAWGRIDTCIHTAESLCCEPETITTLVTGYTPTQNKRFFKKQTEIEIRFWVIRGGEGQEELDKGNQNFQL